MGDDQVKVWRCTNEHMMGVVLRNGSGVRQLLLYREALEPFSSSPKEVEVMAIVEGAVFNVTCSVCGAERSWFPGEEAIRRLIENQSRHGDAGTT